MRAIETASVGLFFALLGYSLYQLSVPSWSIPFALIAGWLLADLFSGLVHWALDTFGSVRTPIVGPAIIRPFREHHADPAGITRHDFIEVNGASCIGGLPLLLFSVVLPLNHVVHAIVVGTCLGILLANQCHKWAHLDAPPAFVKFLQWLGLILRADEHRLHHTAPFNSHFCTANGWLNKPLNALLK